MRILHVGPTPLSRFLRTRPARLGLLASLLVLASFGTILLRGSAQSSLSGSTPSSSLASAASNPLQPASATSAPAMSQPAAGTDPTNPNQEISQLLQMATDLKTEVGKTNQETLSIAVVRKAAAIEQLAHKMRIGGNQK